VDNSNVADRRDILTFREEDDLDKVAKVFFPIRSDQNIQELVDSAMDGMIQTIQDVYTKASFTPAFKSEPLPDTLIMYPAYFL